MENYEGYKRFIEDNLFIVNKEGKRVPFILNDIQNKYLLKDSTWSRDVVLKARQQGFSSVILATFTADFVLKPYSRSVVVADDSDNAIELLDRVKGFVSSYEERSKTPVPLKYNSKYELYNELMQSRYTIGTAKKVEFGRSKTITNLHLSEAAFYLHMKKLLAGALQAVVPNGRAIIETTANGFNEFRKFWFSSKLGETGFKPLFYKASDFYDQEFLEQKKKELKELFSQEYPETDVEAFLASGNPYFDKDSLKKIFDKVIEPQEGSYVSSIS